MRSVVVFSHPGNSTRFYFVDFKSVNGQLKPVGCWRLRRYCDRACVFETKRDADIVVDYLVSVGCSAYSQKLM